jgi:hypothetical protein
MDVQTIVGKLGIHELLNEATELFRRASLNLVGQVRCVIDAIIIISMLMPVS